MKKLINKNYLHLAPIFKANNNYTAGARITLDSKFLLNLQ